MADVRPGDPGQVAGRCRLEHSMRLPCGALTTRRAPAFKLRHPVCSTIVGAVAPWYWKHSIRYTVIRRGRKTLDIAVEPDSTVSIAAPISASSESIASKVRKRAAWILARRGSSRGCTARGCAGLGANPLREPVRVPYKLPPLPVPDPRKTLKGDVLLLAARSGRAPPSAPG